MSTNKKQIAIIGAGLAGATLADKLLNAGCNVTLYEKSRGTGGRISSCRLGDTSADLGAPFLTPASNGFLQWLAQHSGVCEWTPITYDFNGAACDLNHTDGLNRTYYTASPRQSALTRKLIHGAHLQTSIRVGKLSPEYSETDENKKSQNQVLLLDETAKRLGCYDAAIVTAPAKQAAPLLEAVPSFKQHAEAATPTISWVLVLQISNIATMTAELIEGQHPIFLRCIKDNAKPGRSGSTNSETWVLEATSEWSAINRDSLPEVVAEQLKSAFFTLLKEEFNCQPSIISERVHRWLYSRHIHQAFNQQLNQDLVPDLTSGLTQSMNINQSYLWDTKTKIGACGDWLESGDAEGAWLSANKLADQIISELSLI